LICKDLGDISTYTKSIDRNIFRLMKNSLPGPFTFILNATNSVSKVFGTNKKEVGIRVPDHNFIKKLAQEISHPLICSSVNDQDEIVEYTTDPKIIFENYENDVDAVIDCGYGKNVASTVIDCTKNEPQIIRQGAGII